VNTQDLIEDSDGKDCLFIRGYTIDDGEKRFQPDNKRMSKNINHNSCHQYILEVYHRENVTEKSLQYIIF